VASVALLLGGVQLAEALDDKPPPLPNTKPDKADDKDLPKNELPVVGADLFDGFEGPDTSIWSFDSADDEAIGQYVEDGATQGKRALKVTLRGKGKKGKIHLRRDLDVDLSQASAFIVDITSPAPKLSVALALRSEPGGVYQEASPVTLKEGLNRDVRFSLDAATWKNEKSKWQYDSPPVNLRSVARMMLLLFTNDEKEGSFILDNLRVEGETIGARGSGGKVYRDWRPEFEIAPQSPPTASLYEGVQIPLLFRASYRDIFDRNDLACGATVTTPSGKTLDVRGFFGGAFTHSDHLPLSPGRAPVPPWGPFDDEVDTKKSDKKDEKKDASVTDSKKKEAAVTTTPAKPAPKTDAETKAGEAKTVSPVWFVRFTPQEVGRYTLVFYVRNSAGEVRSVEQAMVVAPEAMHQPGRIGGNVRVSLRDPKQLELSDGSPFFIFGQNVCWTQDWSPYLDKIKAYGGNACRIWLCPWGLNLERKSDAGSYDLDEARRLDRLIEKAEATGVRIIFSFTFHGMTKDFWGDSPYNLANGGTCARPQDFFTDRYARTQFKRLLTYATARWGPSPAILSWELMNEENLAVYDSEEDLLAWTREMSAYLSAVDTHKHLITTSVTWPQFRPDIWQDSHIDFVSIHSYGTDVHNVVYKSLSPFSVIKKPVLLAEFGGGWRATDDLPDKDGARLRAALWETMCAPDCGAALPWWWDTYVETRNLYPVFAAASHFMAGEDRRERYGESVQKSYPDGLEVAGAMDNQGARLYVQRPDWTKAPEMRGDTPLTAAEVPLELSGVNDGDYHIEFWDAREGVAFSTADATAKEGRLTIQLPAHKSEFALKVNRKEWLRPGIK
jgi:hypothetical protein